MPKKLGTNPKAIEARARKEEKKIAERERIKKEKEDAYWKDDDKSLMRKNLRREEKEQKRNEQMQRKAAAKAALEEEMLSLKPSSANNKVTRASIASSRETKVKEKKIFEEEPIPENVNRIKVDGLEARGVNEAIAVLSLKDAQLDRHPERRMKAAFTAFEEKNFPRLKAENPNMRLSQIKQMLKKEWLKSPDNPFNKTHILYNHPKN